MLENEENNSSEDIEEFTPATWYCSSWKGSFFILFV